MLSACNRALEFESKNTAAWQNKAIALTRLGRPKDVVPCYDYLLKGKPNDADLWISKGHSLSLCSFSGCREEAIACFDKALEINPSHLTAWANKGWQLTLCERYEEAIACFDRALEIDPNCEELLRGKSFTLHRLGRFDERLGA